MTESTKKNGKQTPGRQRPGNVRSANRRNYASENDVARGNPNLHAELVPKARNQSGSGGRGPNTPQKTPQKNLNTGPVAKSPAPSSGQGTGTVNNNKRNNNDKVHPKNLSASPSVAAGKSAGGRRTPPQPSGGKPVAAGSATPAATAFAGATFHASPAPSALPLPSFFTKKSPGTPTAEVSSVRRGFRQQPSPPASDSEVPSSMATRAGGAGGAGVRGTVPVSAVPAAMETLFQADRAEKERIRRASSVNTGGAVVASPPAQVHLHFDHASSNTFPRGPSQQQHQHHLLMQQQQQTARRLGPTTRSSSGISAAELDGTPGQPLGPSFATSFQERIRAVRPSDTRSSGSSVPNSPFTSSQFGFRDAPAGAGAVPFPRTNFDPQQPAVAFGAEGRKDVRSEALLRYVQSTVPAAAASTTLSGQHSSTVIPSRQPFPLNATTQSSGYPFQPVPSTFSVSAPNNPPTHANIPIQRPVNHEAYTPVNNRPNRQPMDDRVRDWINRSSPYAPGASHPPPF